MFTFSKYYHCHRNQNPKEHGNCKARRERLASIWEGTQRWDFHHTVWLEQVAASCRDDRILKKQAQTSRVLKPAGVIGSHFLKGFFYRGHFSSKRSSSKLPWIEVKSPLHVSESQVQTSSQPACWSCWRLLVAASYLQQSSWGAWLLLLTCVVLSALASRIQQSQRSPPGTAGTAGFSLGAFTVILL